MESKYCKRCHQIKNLAEFNENKKLKNGLSSYCRVCLHELNHEAYLKRASSKKIKEPVAEKPDDSIDDIVAEQSYKIAMMETNVFEVKKNKIK